MLISLQVGAADALGATPSCPTQTEVPEAGEEADDDDDFTLEENVEDCSTDQVVSFSLV